MMYNRKLGIQETHDTVMTLLAHFSSKFKEFRNNSIIWSDMLSASLNCLGSCNFIQISLVLMLEQLRESRLNKDRNYEQSSERETIARIRTGSDNVRSADKLSNVFLLRDPMLIDI